MAKDGNVKGGKGWTRIGDTLRKGSRNWRNNNPGNIEYGPFARSMGAIGTDGRFAVFADYETGRRAKAGLLFSSKGYRNKTLRQAIARYAPEFENNTNAYVNAVARALGIDPGTKLSDLTENQRNTMLDAMQKVEGFKKGREFSLDEFGVARPKVDVPTIAGVSPETATAPAWASSLATPGYAPGSVDRMALAPVAPDKLSPTSSLAYSPNKSDFELSPALSAINSIAPTGPSQERFSPAAQPDAARFGTETPSISADTAFSQGMLPDGGIMSPAGGYIDPMDYTAAPKGDRLGQPAQPASLTASLASPEAMVNQTMGPMASVDAQMGPGMFGALGAPAPAMAPALAPAQEIAPAPEVAPYSPPAVEEAAPAMAAQEMQPSPMQPSLSPGDIYGGTQGTAAATGGNFVSRDSLGTTSVTNPYGATTGMTSGGYQTAYGGSPAESGGPAWGGMSNPFGGIGKGLKSIGQRAIGLDPNRSFAAQKNQFMGQLLGALGGGILAGGIGALGGGLLGGNIGSKRDFPDAPSSNNDSKGVPGGDRTRSERASRSPAASRSIDRGDAVSGLW